MEEISTILTDLGNKLVLFDIYKEHMRLDNELLETFFNLLVDLVLNSVSAIKHFRKNDIVVAVKVLTWNTIKEKFYKTFKDLDSKIDHLRKLAKVQSLLELNRTQADLAQQLARLTAREDVPQQEVQLPCITLPFSSNKSFFGRKSELTQMQEYLDSSSAGTAEIQSLALWGTGGIGKTQIALEYATQQVQNGIQVVLWISCEKEEEMLHSFTKAAVLLHPPGYTDEQTPDQKRFLVLEWLQKTSE